MKPRFPAEHWIETLDLVPHPEGGFFRETYRASESVPSGSLPARYAGDRSFATAIYFLIPEGGFSAFHRLASDEIWHFYDGAAVRLHLLCDTHGYRCVLLGPLNGEGQCPQRVVPGGTWLAAEPAEPSAHALVGCTVAPGFEFADFELADTGELAARYPAHSAVIQRLCR